MGGKGLLPFLFNWAMPILSLLGHVHLYAYIYFSFLFSSFLFFFFSFFSFSLSLPFLSSRPAASCLSFFFVSHVLVLEVFIPLAWVSILRKQKPFG
ncbi:Uncharacterized protein TCM_024019 [Theobroma cacao]|uniref:Uncharacterized protein n=1 Tax=Theobroma cacao TaxID=3641 RepID=A0A061EVI0_THECC|nr:Uncharacterized protein TCM_024019 [Theobroma cacao]